MQSYFADSAIESIISQDIRSGYLGTKTTVSELLGTAKDRMMRQCFDKYCTNNKINVDGRSKAMKSKEWLDSWNKSQTALTIDTANKYLPNLRVVKYGNQVWAIDSKAYSMNKELYRVFLDVYRYLFLDTIGDTFAWDAVCRSIVDAGLIAWIKRCDDYITNYLFDRPQVTDPLLKSLLELCLSTERQDFLGVQVATEIFRFGKRFSPFGNDALAAKSYSDFWECERINKEHDRKEDSYFVVTRVREVAKELFKSWKMPNFGEWDGEGHIMKRKSYKRDEYDIYISPNSISNTCTCRFCKRIALDAVLNYENPYVSQDVMAHIADNLAITDSTTIQKAINAAFANSPRDVSSVGTDIVECSAVPKNWKQKRLIGPDKIDNYHKQTKIERSIRDVLRKASLFKGEPMLAHCPLEDQSVQRNRAQEGSVDGSIDTTDLSSASDFHRKVVIREVFSFNPELVEALLNWVPKAVKIQDKIRTTSLFAPMGSPLTFRVMQTVLLCVCIAATEFVAHISRWDKGRTQEALMRIGVFGDDITCDHEVTETLWEFLEALGFCVNRAKSGTNQDGALFREACGGDYFMGINVSSDYWPRQQIKIEPGTIEYWHEDGFTFEKLDSLSTLISVSKSIRKYSPNAAEYLNDVCRKINENLTSSEIGTPNPDLWSRYPVGSAKIAKTKYRSEKRYILSKAGRSLISDASYSSFIEKMSNQWNTQISLEKGLPKAERQLENYSFPEEIPESYYLLLSPYLRRFYSLEWKDYSDDRDEGRKLISVPVARKGALVLKPKGCVVEASLKSHNCDLSLLLEYYTYQDYLEKGPLYEDALSELLKVSSKRLPDTIFGRTSIDWKLV